MLMTVEENDGKIPHRKRTPYEGNTGKVGDNGYDTSVAH
jgi:hypothetical protein